MAIKRRELGEAKGPQVQRQDSRIVSGQLELALAWEQKGETRLTSTEGHLASPARSEAQSPARQDVRSQEKGHAVGEGEETDHLMELICERGNLLAALAKVEGNGRGPGVDGMTPDQLRDYLKEHGWTIRTQLLEGTYQPQPVRRVNIDKPDGGTRELGIPTVLDRFVQQAVLQVLQPLWDPQFSQHSHGFRPGRRAHDAVREAQGYISNGCRWVVDIDLEKFFDRVNHDRLMSRLASRVRSKKVLRLIGRYLRAGVLAEGVVQSRAEGTPQGGPLSPLLSNIVLDELDRELERRGHRFVRYADDCNIYVASEKAGHRVMASVSEFITKTLKLKVNQKKSAVGRPHQRKFLGFSFTSRKKPQRRIAGQSLERFKTKIRKLTGRMRGRSIKDVVEKLRHYLNGWRGYYGFCETPSVLRDLDKWIRTRLRAVLVKQCRHGKARYQRLRHLGIEHRLAVFGAGGRHGACYRSHHDAWQFAYPPRYFDNLGLPRLEPRPTR